MRRPFRTCLRHAPLGVIVLALPLAVEVDVPSDSSVTQLRVAAGSGHYLAVTRNCDGDVTSTGEDSFYDVAAGIDHKFGGSPIALGVSGGYLHDGRFEDQSLFAGGILPQNADHGFYYVSPSVGLMWKNFGLSVGATYLTHHLLDPNDVSVGDINKTEWLPALAVRAGPTSGPYFTASILSAFPMYSGGGYWDMGIGGSVSDRASLWGGVNLYGLTATGLEARLQWRMVGGLYLDGGTSYGQREHESQYSGTIGVTYRVVH